MKTKLMTKDLERKIPRIYETQDQNDPMAVVKYFTPDSNWTWYGIEYDPEERIFFGLVEGFEKELGYFSLDELESIRGPLGLPIEMDKHFKPKPLSELKRRGY